MVSFSLFASTARDRIGFVCPVVCLEMVFHIVCAVLKFLSRRLICCLQATIAQKNGKYPQNKIAKQDSLGKG